MIGYSYIEDKGKRIVEFSSKIYLSAYMSNQNAVFFDDWLAVENSI